MRLNTVIPLEVSADRAWTLVAEEFGDAAEWASSLTSSQLDRDRVEVGARREARIGKRTVIEQVQRFEPAARVFSYELVDPPAIISSSVNTWTVTETAPNRCDLESRLDLELPWWSRPLSPLLGFGLKRALAAASEEFRVFAETGTPHQRTLDSAR